MVINFVKSRVSGNKSDNLESNVRHSSGQKTNGVNVSCSICKTLSLYSFLVCSLRDTVATIAASVGVKNP